MWVILAVALLLLLLPALRFAGCRVYTALYLRRVCKACGAEMRFRTVLALFDRWGGAKNSLYIRRGERVYSIRLIGFFCRGTHLRVHGETTYSVKNLSVPVVGWVLWVSKAEVKTKPSGDFRAFLPKAYGEVCPCYLLNPCFSGELHLSYGKDGAGVSICEGDRIDGATVFTLRGLAKELQKREDGS